MQAEVRTGQDSPWGEGFLRVTTVNLTTQWVRDSNRFRSQDDPARLDLVLTEGMHGVNELKHECPLGKSEY